MPSPKPEPTKLKLLKGVDKEHPKRINRTEPQPSGEPVAPYWLTGAARNEWKRILRTMPEGVIREIDSSLLALYCDLWGQILRRRREGLPYGPPMLAQLRGLAATFGLTPSDRTRLHVAQPKDETQAKAERFLA